MGNATPFTMQSFEGAAKKPPAQEQWKAMKKQCAQQQEQSIGSVLFGGSGARHSVRAGRAGGSPPVAGIDITLHFAEWVRSVALAFLAWAGRRKRLH
jgi:hypothetical protein